MSFQEKYAFNNSGLIIDDDTFPDENNFLDNGFINKLMSTEIGSNIIKKLVSVIPNILFRERIRQRANVFLYGGELTDLCEKNNIKHKNIIPDKKYFIYNDNLFSLVNEIWPEVFMNNVEKLPSYYGDYCQFSMSIENYYLEKKDEFRNRFNENNANFLLINTDEKVKELVFEFFIENGDEPHYTKAYDYDIAPIIKEFSTNTFVSALIIVPYDLYVGLRDFFPKLGYEIVFENNDNADLFRDRGYVYTLCTEVEE